MKNTVLIFSLSLFLLSCSSTHQNFIENEYKAGRLTARQYELLKPLAEQQDDAENTATLGRIGRNFQNNPVGNKKYYTHGGYMTQKEHNDYVNSQPKLGTSTFQIPPNTIADKNGTLWNMNNDDLFGSNGQHYHRTNDTWYRDDGKWIKVQGNQIINSDGGTGLPK